ncbi:unnamed protein product, partial [Polarella glacialis]
SFQQLLLHGSRAKLVFFTGENVRPPVGKVPLCISFDHLPSSVPSSLHTRIPLWVFNKEVHRVLELHESRLGGDLGASFRGGSGRKERFCCWVASNANMYNAQLRLRFVQSLSTSYKQVDCGGQVMNNVGGPVKDKMEFLSRYKFNICFENASFPGYCTEKLLHAFAAGCVPIYWGDPTTTTTTTTTTTMTTTTSDFNPKAFISAHGFETPELLLRHIERVDQDAELYESYLRQPIFSQLWYDRLKHWPSFCQ